MLSKKGRVIFIVISVICVLGCIGFLYFGFIFFGDRKLVFWLYNLYIVGLTAIVIYMVYRYVKTYIV